MVDVASDFPDLSLSSASFAVPSRSAQSRERLERLGDRVGAIATGALRTDAVAGAYRAFARQIGLDPDIERNPLDEAAVERLLSGGFSARGAVSEALLIAMLETFVPLWAVDEDRVDGELRVDADDDERLVVRDDSRVLAPLMCPPVAPPRKRSKRVVVYGLRVHGVAQSTVDEALWHVRTELG
jgi:hypothetical protein